MNTNKIIKYTLYGLIFAAGIFIGWLLFNGHARHDQSTEHNHSESQIWTCSMHPQIRQDKPGKCPICAMDLIPLKTQGSSNAIIDSDAIQLSEEAVALADIQTTIVSRSNPVKEIRLYGTVKPNERLLHSQVSHVSGRIENLAVNSTGETVRTGQVIATIYSPDLLNAQQELLEAKKLANSQPALLNAVREKLRLWKFTDSQIAEIEQTGKVSPTVNIRANTGGVVVTKRVAQGDYVNQGSVLFDLADLSSVWVVFDAYESDLLYLKAGNKVEYTSQSLPGKTFIGKISFIDPVLNPITRTASIRVEAANPHLELKPEMYANAVIKTSVKRNGNEIVIPKTAVLWTGKRSIVYVKQPATNPPVFKLREIELGTSLGDGYVVLSGINDGEEIVTNGVFTIDASAQLEGKRSMMNMDIVKQEIKHKNNVKKSVMPRVRDNVILIVQGLCDMCKERIEAAANSIKGVSSAVWDSETNQLKLSFDPAQTSLDTIGKVIANAGHDNEKYKADDKKYNTLPGCCKYRR